MTCKRARSGFHPADTNEPCFGAADRVYVSLMNTRSTAASRTSGAATFGSAVRAARTERKISQVELAASLGTTQSLVSAYEAGDHEPPREVVFAIEDALGLSGGSLSRHLGYLPVDYDGRAPLSFRDFLMRDESTLSPDQRRVFLDLYKQFTRAETGATTTKRAASAPRKATASARRPRS